MYTTGEVVTYGPGANVARDGFGKASGFTPASGISSSLRGGLVGLDILSLVDLDVLSPPGGVFALDFDADAGVGSFALRAGALGGWLGCGSGTVFGSLAFRLGCVLHLMVRPEHNYRGEPLPGLRLFHALFL